jgi:hypothetical protein
MPACTCGVEGRRLNTADMKRVFLVLTAVLLAGCSNSDNGIRVSTEKPQAPAPAPVPKARSEPVFYNGKTYNVRLTPVAGGVFRMAVNGMAVGQQKDAVAVATSSLRYFACPDGKTGKLTDQPRYTENTWNMSARCG